MRRNRPAIDAEARAATDRVTDARRLRRRRVERDDARDREASRVRRAAVWVESRRRDRDRSRR
jgi:hypothetical protein